MKNWWKVLIFLFFICLLVILAIGVSYILPMPFAAANLTFAAAIIFLYIRENGMVIWIIFLSHFLMEMYAFSPFGIMLSTSTISMLLGYWLFKYILTNRNWYSAAILTAITVLIYRVTYSVLLLFYAFFTQTVSLPWSAIISVFLWETAFTTLFVAIICGMRQTFWTTRRDNFSSLSFSKKIRI